MNTGDRDKIRRISFREFADEWLERLNPKYDQIGDIWVEIFRPEIRAQLQELKGKVDALLNILRHAPSEEAFGAFVAEFTGDSDGSSGIPAYEYLLPAIRALGGRDDDSALVILAIFEHESRARRLGSAEGDNISAD